MQETDRDIRELTDEIKHDIEVWIVQFNYDIHFIFAWKVIGIIWMTISFRTSSFGNSSKIPDLCFVMLDKCLSAKGSTVGKQNKTCFKVIKPQKSKILKVEPNLVGLVYDSKFYQQKIYRKGL